METSTVKKEEFVYEEKKVSLPIYDVTKMSEEVKQYIPPKEYYRNTGYLKPIAYGVQSNEPILLKGDAGCGKNAALRFIAHSVNLPLRRVNLNRDTTVSELVGTWTLVSGSTVWNDGVLTQCMRLGMGIVADEINACLPEVSFILHSVLDDDRCLVIAAKDGELVKAHPNFRFFATMNPDYAGTLKMNQALEERFTCVVEMGYPDEKDELDILLNKTNLKDKNLLTKMIKVANKVREEKRLGKIDSVFSTRKLIHWGKLCDFFTPSKALLYAVLNKFSREEVNVIKDVAGIIFPEPEFRSVLELKASGR